MTVGIGSGAQQITGPDSDLQRLRAELISSGGWAGCALPRVLRPCKSANAPAVPAGCCALLHGRGFRGNPSGVRPPEAISGRSRPSPSSGAGRGLGQSPKRSLNSRRRQLAGAQRVI